jgi:sensor domain CHASE-containing protein
LIASQQRYYLQRLTEQVFLVRERLSVNGESGPNDRIVHSFAFRDDALKCVADLNERQRERDAHDDHGGEKGL